MKKIIIGFIILLVIVAGIGGYLKFALPAVGAAPDLKITATPERIRHGKYLALHVAACMDCHSTRDWSSFAAPPVAGTLGAGGE